MGEFIGGAFGLLYLFMVGVYFMDLIVLYAYKIRKLKDFLDYFILLFWIVVAFIPIANLMVIVDTSNEINRHNRYKYDESRIPTDDSFVLMKMLIKRFDTEYLYLLPVGLLILTFFV